MGKSPLNTVGDEAHFAQGNPTNLLIKLNNHDSPGTPASFGRFQLLVIIGRRSVSEAPLTFPMQRNRARHFATFEPPSGPI
jgi:hypothetical protein